MAPPRHSSRACSKSRQGRQFPASVSKLLLLLPLRLVFHFMPQLPSCAVPRSLAMATCEPR